MRKLKMPIKGSGWELLITRQSVQTRGDRKRTIGKYKIFHDGAEQGGLAGTSVETKGPGDNKVAGNGRRVEAGVYPSPRTEEPTTSQSDIASATIPIRHQNQDWN
jgi:hypothetical protein